MTKIESKGLPMEWKALLDESGITMMERIHRPDVSFGFHGSFIPGRDRCT